MPPHDRSDLTEENVYPWKARQDKLDQYGPKNPPIYLRGGRSNEMEADFVGEEQKVVVPGGETSMPLYIAEYVAEFGVVLDPSGEARVEYTLSPMGDVTGGLARWTEWDAGNVTQLTRSFASIPVTAIRVVSVSGEVTADIRTEA